MTQEETTTYKREEIYFDIPNPKYWPEETVKRAIESMNIALSQYKNPRFTHDEGIHKDAQGNPADIRRYYEVVTEVESE